MLATQSQMDVFHELEKLDMLANFNIFFCGILHEVDPIRLLTSSVCCVCFKLTFGSRFNMVKVGQSHSAWRSDAERKYSQTNVLRMRSILLSYACRSGSN